MKSDKSGLKVVDVAFDGRVISLPDGTLMACLLGQIGNQQDGRARYSRDNGHTWSEPVVLFKLPMEHGWWAGFECLLDRNGELHLFMLNDAHTGVCWAGEGERPGVGGLATLRLDIWHAKTTGGRQAWQPPHKIWGGYTGALNSVIQMAGGRILLPFSYMTDRNWANRGGGIGEWSFQGMFDSTVLYSDDAGGTWQLSNTLKIFVPDISYAYGACEPVVLELKDGRVWMLIRSQMGRFYESFSTDGAVWSYPRPNNFLSSDSPAGLCRLADGRIAIVWNNCLRYPYAYGGRQVIHAALSDDEGQRWYGFREVFRDPLRNEPPPPDGDYGTGYPFPLGAPDGKLLMMTGQGKGRRKLVILDPAFLDETSQAWIPSQGLETWSVFGTKGVELVSQPAGLALRNMDAEFPAAAVWNFPGGAKGRLKLGLFLRPGFQGCTIALTDHFSVPYDDNDLFFNIFTVSIDAAGRLPGGASLPVGCHCELELRWDCAARKCRLFLNGEAAGAAPLLRDSRTICYLRLKSTTEATADGGFLVDAVTVKVKRS